jgi:repressor LexA
MAFAISDKIKKSAIKSAAKKIELVEFDMQGLTVRQKEILDYIKNYIGLHHYSPSLEEIKTHFSFSSLSTIHEHLLSLKKKKYLTFEKCAKRSIEILPGPQDQVNDKIPIAGYFSSGLPLELFPSQTIFFKPKELIFPSEKIYALKVSGFGLMDDLIFNNDLLIIEATTDLANGDVAICSLSSGPTYLKKIFDENHHMRLEPINPLSSILIETFKKEDITIRGKLLQVIRSF